MFDFIFYIIYVIFCRTKYSIELPPAGGYATGLLFLDQCETKRSESQQKFEEAANELGLSILGWRQVPCNNDTLGEVALKSEPAIYQVFVTPNDKTWTEQVFQRKAYILRKWMTHTLAYEKTGSRFYICSLSTKTLVYKGQFEPCQLWKFSADLVNPDYVTSMCLVHTRYVIRSTYVLFFDILLLYKVINDERLLK